MKNKEECQVNRAENLTPKEKAEELVDKYSDEFDVEKEMFELEQQLDIPSNMRWHNRTSFQTEISDKEIFYQKQVMNPYPSTKHLYTAWEKGFMECAKWMQEQLKKEKGL